MWEGFVIEDYDIDRYRTQLEELLPGQIDDIVEGEGNMIKYTYVPHTLQLLGIEYTGDRDPLTPYYCDWSYCVRHSVVCEDTFVSPGNIIGFVDIPIGQDRELILLDIDFICGLLPSNKTNIGQI